MHKIHLHKKCPLISICLLHIVLNNLYLLKGSKGSLGPRRILCLQAPGGALRKTKSAATAPDRSTQRLVVCSLGLCRTARIGKPVRRAGSGNIFIPERDFHPSRRTQHPTTMNPTKAQCKRKHQPQSFLLAQRTLLANQNLLVTLSSVSLNHCLYKTKKKGALHEESKKWMTGMKYINSTDS